MITSNNFSFSLKSASKGHKEVVDILVSNGADNNTEIHLNFNLSVKTKQNVQKIDKKLSMSDKKKLSRSKNIRNMTHLIFFF